MAGPDQLNLNNMNQCIWTDCTAAKFVSFLALILSMSVFIDCLICDLWAVPVHVITSKLEPSFMVVHQC